MKHQVYNVNDLTNVNIKKYLFIRENVEADEFLDLSKLNSSELCLKLIDIYKNLGQIFSNKEIQQLKKTGQITRTVNVKIPPPMVFIPQVDIKAPEGTNKTITEIEIKDTKHDDFVKRTVNVNLVIPTEAPMVYISDYVKKYTFKSDYEVIEDV